MTARLICFLLFSGASLAGALPARADWLAEIAHCIVRDTKRRSCWPKPFSCPDRYAVRAPFAVMVNNGWRFQNMLGDNHFSEDGLVLNETGRSKVRWILSEAPPQHRTIYVYKGATPAATTARIESVQQLAAKSVPYGPPPLVLQSDVPAHGWPAARVDTINRKFESSTPDPRLPEVSSGGDEGT